jgi:hypothetical protein
MRAYVCVYRHSTPSPRERQQTEQTAAGHPLLLRYLESYDEPGSVLDWGDDPSFFAASELLGDVRRATWGVCRRDVRASLGPGDFVVFVCGRQDGRSWEYFFVGVATLGQPLTRELIWSDDQYEVHRGFFNVLARSTPTGLEQHEYNHRFHDDWRKRCNAPYWVFDLDDTRLEISSPVSLAGYRGEPGQIERWETGDERVAELRSLLLRGARPTRGLRSTNLQRAHPKLNLSAGYPSDVDLRQLRSRLIAMLDT